MRPRFLTRATALVLAWVIPATSTWALAPAVPPRPVARGLVLPPLLALPSGWGTESVAAKLGAPGAAPLAGETAWQDDEHHPSGDHHHHAGCDHAHDRPGEHDDDDNDDAPDSCHVALRPVLECVAASGSSYVAHFGYDNESAGAVSVPVGTNNKFTPTPAGRGQPAVFQPGRTARYPSAAFTVPFSGGNLVWSLNGPDHQTRTATASATSQRCTAPAPPPPSPPPCAVPLFGPQRYTRTTGAPNTYTATLTVPAWVAAPYILRVQNGEPSGANRVSSATIKVNSVQVAGPADFNQNVPGFERAVTLTPETTLRVTLSSKPGSYLTLSLCGGQGDATRPIVTWARPVEGATLATATPSLLVKYQDLVGANEPAVSGVDTTSLQVWIDDVDQTALFTRRSSEASADVPAALALVPGAHRVRARIRDVAGNSGEGSASFVVDVAPPTIAVAEPAAGAYLATPTPTVRLVYADNVGLDLASLRVLIKGVDRTSLFANGPSGAVATLNAGSALPNGAADVQAFVKDRAGHEAQASRSFNVDTQAPSIVITHPTPASQHGRSTVEVLVQYRDDQKLDLGSFQARIDGALLTLTVGEEGAQGFPAGLADGAHQLTASVRDAAGTPASTSVSFTVDTAAPYVAVLQPPPGSTIATATPPVVIGYSDAQGIGPATLKVHVNDVDRTSWCLVQDTGATCSIPAVERLSEGGSTIRAEVRDLTGNLGSTSSAVTVDTVAPTAGLVQPVPGSNVKLARPAIQVAYADTGSGVDTASVRVSVDGVDRTASFARAASGATGTLDEALGEGRHDVRITLSDHAGNTGAGEGWFVVDTVAPQATIVAPAPDGFYNDATPAVNLTYADSGGSGVDVAGAAVFLISGSDPPVDITSSLARGEGGVTGTLAERADGSYRLRLVVSDRAGNQTTVEGGFEIDTRAPRLTLESPTGYVDNASPPFSIAYSDEGSGVELASLTVLLDGVDRASELARGPLRATGTLGTPLANGARSVSASVRDRAGNATTLPAQTFTVDTVAPTIAVAAPPDGSYLGTAQPQLTVRYSDADVAAPTPLAAVTVKVDDVDRAAEFTIGLDKAEAVLAPPFAEGRHSISAEAVDWAGHRVATPVSRFDVDTLAPVVTVTSPAEGSYHPASPVEVTGTVVDADPQVAVTCAVGGPTVPAAVSGTTFICAVSLSEGTNTVVATATDRLGHAATTSRGLVLDTTAPVVTIAAPAEGSFHAASPVELTGTLAEADSETTVVCHAGGATVPATVSGAAFTCVLPLAEGAHTLTATATDRLSHVGSASRTVTLDTTPPVVTIATPVEGSYHAVSPVAVTGTVVDSDPQVSVVCQAGSAAVPATIASGGFTCLVPLVDGANTITATATDRLHHAASASRGVILDTRAPEVSIDAPAEGSYHRANPVTVTGTVGDGDPQVTVTCRVGTATVPAAISGAAFTCAVTLAEGDDTVTAAAADRLGHQGTASRLLKLDTRAPVVTILQPGPNDYTNASTITVSGSVVDPEPSSPITSVTVNGVAAQVDGATFTAEVPVAAATTVTLTADAVDSAGNHGAASVDVQVDREAPQVVIETPLSQAYLRGPTIEVAGRVADASSVQLLDVNQQVTTVTNGRFQVTLPVTDGPLTITATARDVASNVGSASTAVTIDSLAPVITLSHPTTPTVLTRSSSVEIAGTVADASPTTLRLGSTVVPVAPDGRFTVTVTAATDGTFDFVLTAADLAQNTSMAAVRVIRDTQPPDLTVHVPVENSFVSAVPVLVQGVATDENGIETVTVEVSGAASAATLVGAAWSAAIATVAEGPQLFVVRATDKAGNVAERSVPVTVDLGAPVVSITSPTSPAPTSAAAVTVSGIVQDRSAVTVAVTRGTASGPATVTKTGPQDYEFTASVTLAEGDNEIRAVATDQTGHSGQSPAVLVTRDSQAPTVSLTVPETVTKRQGGRITVSATDASGVTSVVVKLGADVLASFTSPPYEVDLVVPASAKGGDILQIRAEATDGAHNTGADQEGVRVLSDGVLVGQVLSDLTSLPLAEATVRMGAREVLTDERGRYSLPTGEPGVILQAGKAGMTEVERDVLVSSGVGTVPVDARLTPLAEPVTIDVDGGTLGSSPLQVVVPGGALPGATPLRLTRLTAQGLPALLPLGYSPLLAFDLTSDVSPLSVGDSFQAIASGLAAGPLHLVQFRRTSHAWVALAIDLFPNAGDLTFDLPGPGSYALVRADVLEPPLPPPAMDAVVVGAEMVPLPATATSASKVDPAILPPAGGTALGTLTVVSPDPLPSGTVVQADVTETFTLVSGDVASEETRRQDLVLFRAPVPASLEVPDPPPAEGTRLYAQVPITPSRTFGTADLVSGKVHLDILAGREGVRGKAGGNEPVDLTDAIAHLVVPRGALSEDTAVVLASQPLTEGLPSSATAAPLAQAAIDLAGNRLQVSADLSVEATGLPADGMYLVARTTRVDGIPRLEVVAFASLAGDRLSSQALYGLPGIVQGGQYVFYRVAGAVGRISGALSTSAGPVKGVLETMGLPFVGLSGLDGRYTMTALPGPAHVTARVPRTSLVGSGTVDVAVEATAALDILLAGAVTTATVTPADGAAGVLTSAPIHITTSTALTPASVTADNVQLLEDATTPGSAGTPLAIRLVLSGSGKLLAVVPQQPLKFSRSYTLAASGLVDVFGGLVSVPTVHFTTRADTPPVYNTAALTFSFPDADGNITVHAPAGSFPPGSQVLILNSGNGDVATFTADNDGAIGVIFPATIRGSINDTLLVTITDPQGNVTTFNRSQFVDPATGITAIGPGGGTVTGEGGVELRIPEGALEKGVTLKIEGMTAEQLETLFPDQKPEVEGATLGSGLKIESPEKPAFNKEAKLAFPVPAGVPEDPTKAFYYVYRRVVGPQGKVYFETLDHAFVECPTGQTTCAAEDRKVVTASFPFAGYGSSFGSFAADGLVSAATVNYAIMMWTFNSLLPGKPLPGVITGKVLRTKWDPGAAVPSYEVIKDAVVTAQDASLTDLGVSQKDGTFTLFDSRYIGGTVTIQATVNGVTLTGTAYEANPADWSTSGLRFYRNIASANITFPPLEPPAPAPDIQTVVMRLVDGKRTDIGGLVVANTPLIIGFTAKNGEVRGATLQGQDYGVRVDPLRGQAGGMDFILDPDFTPAQPGTYTVTATALPITGSPVTASYTFRVIGAGGGIDNVPGAPPAVITAKTVPKAGATGVAVTLFPQVAFTEPVRRIPGNVRLLDAAGAEAAIKLSGVTPDGSVVENITDANQPITSLTVQPRVGLRYGTTYRLVLTEGIEDLDQDARGNPAPKNLVPTETSFTTFGPVALTAPGTGETFTSPGIAVLGDRAYLVQNNFINGTVRAFDIADPVAPREIESARAVVTWRPVDIVAEAESTISQGRLVTVATSSTSQSKPSNIYLFDTSSDTATRWIGAVSLTNSAFDGYINRIVTKDGFLYAATGRKGIQVVDLAQGVSLFEAPGTADHYRMVLSFNTDGQGFGSQAVVQTIPVNDDAGRPQLMFDLKVGEFVVDGQSQPIVVATGFAPFVVVNPQMSAVVAKPAIVAPDGSSLSSGQALALGTIEDRRVAVVVGTGIATGGGSTSVLAVVSVNDPTSPVVLSVIALEGVTGALTDVVLKDSLALVGTSKEVLLVSLQDPSRPVLAGRLDNVAGRLALTDSNLLLGSARSVFGGSDPLGGVRSAALGDTAFISKVDPEPILVSAGDEVFRNVDFTYRLIPPVPQNGEVRIDVKDGGRVATLSAPIDESGNGTTRWTQGTIVNLTKTYEARLHAVKDGQDVPSFPRRIRFDKVPLAITTRDRLVRVQFALPQQGLFTERKYSVKVFVAAQDQDFGTTPAFSVTSQQIEDAYANADVWWDDLEEGTGRTTASWVTRKIETIDLPPGTDRTIRRQAFEIGALFGGYPKLRVQVIGDESGTVLADKQGSVTANGGWSEVLSNVNDQVRKAAGQFVPIVPIVPEPGSFDPARLFAPLSGLTVRAIYWVLEKNIDTMLLSGLITGFKEGLEGDKDTVVMLAKAAISPIETARAIATFLKDFVATISSGPGISGIINVLLDKLQGVTMPTAGEFAYYTGYLIGFLFEQVLVGVALAVITVGIGAAVAKAAQVLKGLTWVANLLEKGKILLKSLTYVLNGARDFAFNSSVARTSLQWLKESADVLDVFWRKYPNSGKILERAGKAARVSKVVAQRALYWLTIVDRMTDEAAARLIRFFEKVGQEAGDQWLTRWTGLTRGKSAVKAGFESTERTGEAAEGVHDALVVAGTLNPPDIPTKSYPRDYSTKYDALPEGGRVETSLARLRRDAADARFDDEAVAETVKFHSRADVPPMSDDAVEGTARLANIPCTRVAALAILASILVPSGCGKVIPDVVANNYRDLLPRFERAMENLKRADDVAADEAFARLFWASHNSDPEVAAAVLRAASFPNASPQAVAEYMKAVDYMRDASDNNRIVSGLLDQAETVLGSSVNVKRVGNQGLGSLAEGFEPVAMKRLIDGLSAKMPRSITREEIEAFGKKLNTQAIFPGGSPRSIEADCLLKDGTFIDMKHSMRDDPYITEIQVENLKTVLLSNQRPIQRVWFVANAPVDSAINAFIRQANNDLKAVLGIDEDLIKVIDDIGTFQ